MKIFYMLFVLILSSLTAWAQNSLKGKILNSEGSPVDFANIVVYKGEERICGISSDQEGHYSLADIADGEYLIKVSRIGYHPISKKIRLENADHLTKDFTFPENRGCGHIIKADLSVNKSDTRQHTTFGSGQLRRMPIRNLHN
ncbi:MAG: carboxypeptidase-like regulatory domain-containing protein [Flavobacteriales bacterium]